MTKRIPKVPKVSSLDTILMEMDFSVLEYFPDHRFSLYTGQRLADMVESIKEYGILQPIIVWHK